MKGRKLLVFTLLLFQIVEFIVAQYEDDNDNMFRLPTVLIPEEYSLSLLTATDQDTFSGTVSITLNLAEENATVEYIYLHADTEYVTITYAQLNDEYNCTVEGLNNYMVKLSCENITEINNVLYIEFDGKYSVDDEYGLVKADYWDSGTRLSLVEARFDPTFARRAFPCFDEPDFTATFSVEIIYPKDYNVISNTLSESTENEDDDYLITIFETTPKIAPYLLTIFVSKFKEVVTTDDEEYSFKLFARSDIDESMLNVASTNYGKIMEALTEFTGQTFQETGNSESYQVAIPDYYAENMGNFGLFAYRERDVLDEGDKTSAKVEQSIIQNLAQKLSHQWFGGEVTSTWWSDIWANEAVPTYFKYVIADKVNEEFEITNQFVLEVVQKSMQYDAMPFVRPLSSDESDIENEWDIEHKFDKNSLLKGATLLSMINLMLGEDKFKDNLQEHLQNRNGSDTNGEDLLEDLTTYEGIQDLYAASHPWAFIAGFPLLIVNINETGTDKEVLKLSQKPFVYPTEDTSTYDSNVKWNIPISYTTSTNKNFNTTINVYYATNVEIMINNWKDDWTIFNLQGRQHYRVNYEEELWRRILNALNNETERALIHPLSRAQLIDDIFNIARTGDVDYSLAFEMADTLVYETDYYPWYSAFNAFSYLLGKMGDDEAEESLKTYILGLMDNIINIPEFTTDDNENHIDVLKRAMVMDWACKLGHYGCINFTMEQFANYKENRSSLEDYNLREVILCNGIRHTDNLAEDWGFLWGVYTSSSTSVHEQYDILQALGCSEDYNKISIYVIEIILPKISAEIKRQDSLVVFESLLSSATGVKADLVFLSSSIKYIKFMLNGAAVDEVYVLADMVLAIAEKVTTDDQLETLKGIVDDSSLSSFPDLKTRATTFGKVNNYWAKQYKDVVKGIISDKISTTESITTTETAPTSTSLPTQPITTETPPAETTTDEPNTTPDSGEDLLISRFMIAICTALLVMYNFLSINL